MVLGGARMAQQDGDDLLAIEAAGLAEKVFSPSSCRARGCGTRRFAVDGPAGEGARRGLDIGLAIVASPR